VSRPARECRQTEDRTTRKGNRWLRTALVEAALSASHVELIPEQAVQLGGDVRMIVGEQDTRTAYALRIGSDPNRGYSEYYGSAPENHGAGSWAAE
jgi:hypothetical protein